MQVRRTLYEPRGGCVFEAPKSGKGRNVRLAQRATSALKEHRKRQIGERMPWGRSGRIMALYSPLAPVLFSYLRPTSTAHPRRV